MRKPDLKNLWTALSRKPLLLLAAAIVLIGIGCAWWYQQLHRSPALQPEAALFSRIEEPRMVFAEVFRSYDSEAAVTTALEAAGLTVQQKVTERPFSKRYPPRRVASLTVQGYKHLDCEGVLVLEFFNNRLMETDFRPDDAGRYAPRLHRQYPGLRRDRNGHAEYLAAPLRIWATVDLAKSKVGRTLGSDGVVLWQDARLIAQRDDWDARYGHIPVPVQ